MISLNATEIVLYKFAKDSLSQINKEKWPVVYIIKDKKLAYIGETTNLYNRTNQHLSNPKRTGLNELYVVLNQYFNKSVILDLEAFLIRYMSADGKYKLLNANLGQNIHNYYQRDSYQQQFKNIWKLLQEKGIVIQDLRVIENSDLFKYSPYKILTEDQYRIIRSIIKVLTEDFRKGNHVSMLVKGGAGTGKTILGIFLLKLLVDAQKEIGWIFDDIDESLNNMVKSLNADLKIGYVVPMQNFRKTLKKVFKGVEGLSAKMVLSPADVANSSEMFDLLIVDEAHRLRRRYALSGPGDYNAFDIKNKEFGLEDGTELDWILKKSRYQIFFYDMNQSIKPTDVPSSHFKQLFKDKRNHIFTLFSQLRCKGGEDYIQYLDDIFNCLNPKRKKFKDYDLKLFSNVRMMTEEIIRKDSVFGLCRNVAGYAWKWNTKGKTIFEITQNNIADIEIEGERYIWNMTDTDWINSENSLYEIGCIHTTQGYDLNYVGVILGPEIDYDVVQNRIIVDKSKYMDAKGKIGIDNELVLTDYIINIYKTMMQRGILGVYLYVCNGSLRQYLSKFFDVEFVAKPVEKQLALSFGLQTNESSLPLHPLFHESEITDNQKYLEYLPVYSLQAACGYFGDGEEVDIKGWVQIPPLKSKNQDLFIVQAVGHSMEPIINDGDYCIFKANPVGSREGKIVLVQHHTIHDPDTGGSYTIKKYHSEKVIEDGTWYHTKILLIPQNQTYHSISIEGEIVDDFHVCGEFVRLV